MDSVWLIRDFHRGGTAQSALMTSQRPSNRATCMMSVK